MKKYLGDDVYVNILQSTRGICLQSEEETIFIKGEVLDNLITYLSRNLKTLHWNKKMTTAINNQVMNLFNDIDVHTVIERKNWLELRGFTPDLDAMNQVEIQSLILQLLLRREELKEE